MQVNSINAQYTNRNLYNQKRNGQASNPSFKGGLSDAYEAVAKSNRFQKFVHNFAKSDNTFTKLLVAESCFLSGFYMYNTIRNKKIDKEQKPQMLINDALTLGVSTAGAVLAEDKITNVVMKGAEKFFEKNGDFYRNLGSKAKETAKKELLDKVGDVASKSGEELKAGLGEITKTMSSQLKNVVGEEGSLKAFQMSKKGLGELTESVASAVTANKGNIDAAKDAVGKLVDKAYSSSAARSEAEKVIPGINKLKVLVIFGLIYRYLGPVVITPIANKLSSKLFEKKDNKQQVK